jgi:hypothetical protein
MTNKFNIGDVVYMKLGYSDDSYKKNYAGAGYLADSDNTFTIRAVVDGTALWYGKYIYFFDEVSNGVVEHALSNKTIDRHEQLEIMGI